METTFKWYIIGLICEQGLNGYIDVVTWVQWRCTCTQIEGDLEDPVNVWYADKDGSLDIPFIPSNEYMPRNELTDEIVLSWVYANGVDKAAVEAEVQALINQQSEPHLPC